MPMCLIIYWTAKTIGLEDLFSRSYGHELFFVVQKGLGFPNQYLGKWPYEIPEDKIQINPSIDPAVVAPISGEQYVPCRQTYSSLAKCLTYCQIDEITAFSRL